MYWLFRAAQLLYVYAFNLGISTFTDSQVLGRVATHMHPVMYIMSAFLIIVTPILLWLTKEELRYVKEGAVNG